MSKFLIPVCIVTTAFFVSVWSSASPQKEVPDSPVPVEPWPNSPSVEDMSIAKPPRSSGKAPAANSRYYTYQQALTFRGGVAMEAGKTMPNDKVIGFQYLFPKFLAPKLEAGADLHEKGIGHLHLGARWILWERSYFRPSAKLALDHLLDSSQKLATFTNLNNYFLRASGTLEYTVWNPYSLRLEHELLLSPSQRFAELSLGLSRGW